MIKLRDIYLIAAALIVSLCATYAQDGYLCNSHLKAATPIAEIPSESHETQLSQSISTLLTSTTTTGATPTISPIARTLPRSIRSTEHKYYSSRVVSAIDNTTAATLYGLYNHKILFTSHARQYYLYRFVRLII